MNEPFDEIRDYFAGCQTPEQIYEKIIALGKRQTPLAESERTEANRVRGCQSTMYLVTTTKNRKLFFKAESDALISSGLAQLLIWAYNGASPEVLLTTPPIFLRELAIPTSLSPSRANGLASLHLQMQRAALAAC